MKCTIPEISWHNRDPVLSIDIQPVKTETDGPRRLASGGTDSHVVIWHVYIQDSGVPTVEFAADLQRHQRAVNVVRFSPSGEFLASGDDESAIIIWKQKTDQDAPEFPSIESDANKEQWLSVRMLRGHMEDVFDLSWSMDSLNLISGSVDNTAILWDVQKGRNLGILKDHSGFVQGVAWDPKNQYVATLSSDRICRIYNVSTKRVMCRVSKARLPVPEGSELDGKVIRLFHDDTLKSFFRRLSFSPDGEILVTPSGLIEIPNSDKHCNATYIFTRSEFNRPAVYLPSPNQYTVAVRFCPLLFELHEGDSMFALPYRMILAVATQCSVVLYDTQQAEPFALISNIHYTRLTDMTWSSDGRMLMVSSTDGYCSIIIFSPGELGKVYQPKDSSVQSTNSTPMQNVSNVSDKEDKSSISNKANLPEGKKGESNGGTVGQEGKIKAENVKIDNRNVTIPNKPPKRICPKPVSKKEPVDKEKSDKTSGNKPVANSDGDSAESDEVMNVDNEGTKDSVDVIKMKECKSEESVSQSLDDNSIPKKSPAEKKTVKRNCPISAPKGNSQSEQKSQVKSKSISESQSNTDSVVEAVPTKGASPRGKNISSEMSEDGTSESEQKRETEASCVGTPEKIKTQNDQDVEMSSPNKKVTKSTVNIPVGNNSSGPNTLCEKNVLLDGSGQEIPNEGNKEASSEDITQTLKTESGVSPQRSTQMDTESSKTDVEMDIEFFKLDKRDNSYDNKLVPSADEEVNKQEVVHTTPRKLAPRATERRISEVMDVDQCNSTTPQEMKQCNTTPGNQDKRTPRRVQFITIASPKSKKKLL